MGRRPKSDEEKELSGAFAKNPQRRKKKAESGDAGDLSVSVVGGDLGPPPAKFLNKHSPTSVDHLEAWREVERAAQAAGVQLTEAHRIGVETLARAIVIMRRSDKGADCKTVAELSEKLGIAKIPPKRQIEKAVEKPEADEWSRLTTPPAPPATRVQ